MSRRKGFLESRNPIMSEERFLRSTQNVLDGDMTRQGPITTTERMTVQGAINKTLILGAIMLLTALVGFSMANPLFMWGGAIGGFIIVLLCSFRPERSATLAPVYAGLEGLFVGSISAVYATFFNGIVFQAITLTMAVLFLMLFIYKSGIIKVTNKFRTGVMMATGAILVVYLLNFVLSLFGVNLPYLHDGGMIGIGISLVIVGIASLNLLLDFDNFEKGEKYGAPSYMEWFSAMGLLITLVWLYIEILRLIALFSSND
ncbi:MAG TPA: Bax inhibitor-1/YccA family protein [Saprospiraceae bacterium]|nr:Bax inhibitor-1/YccA family protein [Saprospiraceae bacterium]HMQ83653.1 Bax inhibitor-1/YccA family protein [Saprospiraceae bacterium]